MRRQSDRIIALLKKVARKLRPNGGSTQGRSGALYASHTVWQSKPAFEAWTKSEAFRIAHARAGNETTGPLYLEHPKFEGFKVRQTVTRLETAAA